MKMAITGKGGVGKTTIAAILARTLTQYAEVVAVDADPNPNLALALGMGIEAGGSIRAITNALLDEKLVATPADDHGHDGEEHEHGDGHDHGHADPRGDEIHDPEGDETPALGAERLLADLGVMAPDGVRLILTGRIERPSGGCLCCGSHRTSRQFFDELDSEGRVVVADLEAGVNDLMWIWPKREDTVLIVTETYTKSIEVAKRALQVTRELEVGRIAIVANRVETADDVEELRKEFPGLPMVVIPDDPALAEASRQGRSPMDTAPDCPTVKTLAAFAPLLLEARPVTAGEPAAVGPGAPRPEPATGSGHGLRT